MKNPPSVCIIGVYFGKLHEWFNLWLLSVKRNPSVDFLMVTDQTIENAPPNLKTLPSSLASFKELAEKKLGFKIKLETPYKLCDYRPVYGVLLEDELVGYDYWGECDFDVIFGDLRKFFDEYRLHEYDKFMNRGHLTLYKNTPAVNARYKLSGGIWGSYREVFRSDLNWYFDETPGINAIYEKRHFPCMNQFLCADIDLRRKDIRLMEYPGELCKNYERQIFYWEDGRLLRDSVRDGLIVTDEFAYIHLQKRKMPPPGFDADALSDKWGGADGFYIASQGFFLKEGATDCAIIERYNKKSDELAVDVHLGPLRKLFHRLRYFWLGRRALDVCYPFLQSHMKLLHRFLLSH